MTEPPEQLTEQNTKPTKRAAGEPGEANAKTAALREATVLQALLPVAALVLMLSL